MFNYSMGKKILIIEDDLELSSLLREKMESCGWEVKVCDNGREVVECMESYSPDLLLMDVMLPGLDGYSLANTITGEEKFKRVPIIVMSALPTSQFMFERIPQVAAFFSKPFNMEDLAETVKTALAGQR